MKRRITFLALISFFVLGLSFQSEAQVINTDFLGVWSGTDKKGVSYEITLNSNWTCTCKINGTVNPDIIGYRIYSKTSIGATPPDQASTKQGDFIIKFFTQNAISGIYCPGSNQGSTGSLAMQWDQTYNGSVTLDPSFTIMTLFITLNTTPCSLPAHSFSGNPVILKK